MGKIAAAIKSGKLTADGGAGGGWRSQGTQLWDRALGRDKVAGPGQTPTNGPPGGPIKGRSLISPNERSFVKLLEAMRSDAPGGWSDDRWEQTMRHFTGITYVAIHRLSQQLSRAEFQVFREDPDHPDGRSPVSRSDKDGWELVTLLKKPNRQDSFGKLMYRWSQQKRLTGTALTWLVPNHFGRPYEMYSVPTALAIPQSATNPLYPHGYYRMQPVYPYGPFSTWPSATTSVGAAIPAEWVMKFQYPHPLLRYDGYSPMTGMRLHIDAIEMIDKARHYLMRRGIHPNAVLNSTDAEGTEELNNDILDRLKAEFEGDHMGPENFGRLFVAYAGWKLEQWGNPPSEMAFEQGWDQLSSFILGGGFGITKPAAGMVEDSSYQTLFATMKQLHLITLDPDCNEISQDLTRHVAPYFGDDLIVDVRLPRIDDHEIRFTRIDKAITGKCITKNELRKELEFPLTKEEWGADFAGEAPQQEQPGGEENPMAAAGAEAQPGADGSDAGAGGAVGEDPMAALASLAGEDQGTGGLGANSKGPQPGKPLDLSKRLTTIRHGKGLGRIARIREELLTPAPRPSIYDLFRGALTNGKH